MDLGTTRILQQICKVSFLCNTLAFFVLLSSWQLASAAVPDEDSSQWVEIVFPATEFVPYSERRPVGQITTGFQYESTLFENYKSPIDQQSYGVLFGKSRIDIIQVSVGYKVNIPFVGFGLEGVYGRGTMSDTRSGQAVGIALSKKGLKGLLVFDGIFSESYVVPYLGAEFVQWDLTTSNDIASASLTTASAIGTTAGLYLSLSWLDKRSALRSYNDGGLNNTYLDIFVHQYQAPGNSGDPDLSGLSYGAGFKLEF